MHDDHSKIMKIGIATNECNIQIASWDSIIHKKFIISNNCMILIDRLNSSFIKKHVFVWRNNDPN